MKAFAGIARLLVELAALGFEGGLAALDDIVRLGDGFETIKAGETEYRYRWVPTVGYLLFEGRAVAALGISPLPDEDVIHGCTCEVCGCTDVRACLDGCRWVRVGLCSVCFLRPLVDALNGMLRAHGFMALARGEGVVVERIEDIVARTLGVLAMVVDRAAAAGSSPVSGRWVRTRQRLLSEQAEAVVAAWTDREHDVARMWALGALHGVDDGLPPHLAALADHIEIQFPTAREPSGTPAGGTSSPLVGPPSTAAELDPGSTTAAAAPAQAGEGGGAASSTGLAAPQLSLEAELKTNCTEVPRCELPS